jgi:hypothetical protein
MSGDRSDLGVTDFDPLEDELAALTDDWTNAVVIRSYHPSDRGWDDYQDEAWLFEEHRYALSVAREGRALTATYRRTHDTGDGHRTTIVRTYESQREAEAVALFEEDAAGLASEDGYLPIDRSWDEGEWSTGQKLMNFFLLFGLLSFLVKPTGRLTVSFANSSAAAERAPHAATPRTAGQVPGRLADPSKPPLRTTTDAVAFCTNCGTPRPLKGLFCGRCGKPLTASLGRGDGASGWVENDWADEDEEDESEEVEQDAPRLIDWGASIILIGGALTVLGSFLPWITATVAFAGTITRSGLDGGGDGLITIIVGIVASLLGVALVARTGNSLLLQAGAVICAAIVGLVAGIDINSVNDRLQQLSHTNSTGSVGVGLIVTALAAALMVVGAVVSTRTAT